MNRFLLLLIFLIPFQRRFYKLLNNFSASLIHPEWHFPASFDTHIDWFVTDFVMLFLFLWSLRSIEWRSFLWEKERKYLTLFLIISLGSIAGSHFIMYPLHYWRWLHLAIPALLFYLVSRQPLENFTSVAKVVLASSLLQCAIAIPQYFIQHSLGLKWIGEHTLISRHFLGATFPIQDGSLWIFDRLFDVVRNHTYVIRAYGTLPHPNILGGMMVFGLLMTYYLYGIGKKRGWLGVAIALQVFCLVITYSRSAIYAWGAATLLWIFLDFWKEKKINSLIWFAGGSFVVCLVCFYPQLFERGGVVSYNAVTQSSDQARLTLHDIGLMMLKIHPFLGVGFNNYLLTFQELAQGHGIPAMFIHNVYLLLGVEVGILGLLPFLGFCFIVLKKGWRYHRIPQIQAALVLFIALLGIGLVDYYPLFNQQTRLIFFLAAGLLSSSVMHHPSSGASTSS